jgi:hypothetical protein
MAQVFREDDGPALSAQYRLMIRTERTKARERKKNDVLDQQPYTEEQIEEIDAQYSAETPRGSKSRWWEDVKVGDRVGPMVKGPMTVTDMVCWHAGVGMGLYDVKPLRLGYKNRMRIPRFYQRDDLNVPDVMQRVHWDPEFARRAGNPRRGSSISAPTGWEMTPGCGSSNVSSASSTSWATRNGFRASSPIVI